MLPQVHCKMKIFCPQRLHLVGKLRDLQNGPWQGIGTTASESRSRASNPPRPRSATQGCRVVRLDRVKRYPNPCSAIPARSDYIEICLGDRSVPPPPGGDPRATGPAASAGWPWRSGGSMARKRRCAARSRATAPCRCRDNPVVGTSLDDPSSGLVAVLAQRDLPESAPTTGSGVLSGALPQCSQPGPTPRVECHRRDTKRASSLAKKTRVAYFEQRPCVAVCCVSHPLLLHYGEPDNRHGYRKKKRSDSLLRRRTSRGTRKDAEAAAVDRHAGCVPAHLPAGNRPAGGTGRQLVDLGNAAAGQAEPEANHQQFLSCARTEP